MKLDAKFEGEIRKVKDSSVVPGDEYVVFLAKDTAFALYALPAYLSACKELGADPEQIAAVRRMHQRVMDWRAANPERCKTPDAKGERLLDQPGVLRLGHPFRARQKFLGGHPTGEVDERECGWVIDAMVNAPSADDVKCGRPPEEH